MLANASSQERPLSPTDLRCALFRESQQRMSDLFSVRQQTFSLAPQREGIQRNSSSGTNIASRSPFTSNGSILEVLQMTADPQSVFEALAREITYRDLCRSGVHTFESICNEELKHHLSQLRSSSHFLLLLRGSDTFPGRSQAQCSVSDVFFDTRGGIAVPVTLAAVRFNETDHRLRCSAALNTRRFLRQHTHLFTARDLQKVYASFSLFV